MTAAELAEYLAQGCVFLPASGYCYIDEEANWEEGVASGLYWSSKQESETSAYYLYCSSGDFVDVYSDNKSGSYYSCRLVRE